jgi:hypothetical protein
VTHHGSSPGQPRGRRARPNNDVPEWAGYDAVQQDQRESAQWRGDGYPPTGPGYPSAGAGYPPGGTAQPEAFAQQAPPSQPPLAPQEPQGVPDPLGPQGPQGAPGQQQRPQDDWAGPADTDPMMAFSERWRRRGSVSRQERRMDRRKRRRLLFAGGGAVAVAIAVGVYFMTSGGSGSANLGLGSLVTTFLPGELQQVPNSCTAVPGGTLGQYLPGTRKIAAPPLNTGAQTECTWTLDKPPMYRVLEVNMQAYSPSGLAPGDGSATFAAQYAYAQDESVKQHPGPRSGQPKATITDLTGLPGGNDTVAFESTQVFNTGGASTDVATVYVRYRNVIVTVVMNGLDHANKGNYGPETPSQLSQAAQTVAQQVTGQLVH